MSNLLELELITPEGVLLQEKVQNLIAKTEQGEIGILYNHAELRAKLDNTPVRFTLADGKQDIFAVLGGIIELSNNKITILTNFAEQGAHIDEAQAKNEVQKAETEFKLLSPNASKTDSNLIIAEVRLQRELLRLKTARLFKEL
ncbi:MAG: ATP synthase F1 subunit epsilon [Candidatus Melainabacteria bacterium]|jgi:F-type H+-transporting ATPase subunit epsilon|nr:ATP synthase F1 subunit epsilon [Candidatus Melainabacteria bacterium]